MSTQTNAEFWEERYRAQPSVWSGRPNAALVDVLSGLEGALAPGTALDLGCGEGGDTLWLASQGWHVRAVDVSATALARTAERAAAAGLGDRVVTERHDLDVTFPQGSFDLVSAHFLRSPLEFGRQAALRRAADAVAPGGLLLVVDHAAPPPWSQHRHEGQAFPTLEEAHAALDLDPTRWTPHRIEARDRDAVGPEGEHAVMTDLIVSARRVR